MKQVFKKWWFWLIILILIIGFFGDNSEDDNNTNNSSSTNSTVIQDNQNNVTDDANNTTNEFESLENKIKKVLYKYDFDSLENENGIVTLSASTTGNAQYSIASDVNFEYVHSLAPIVYENEEIQNFIFKVTITDNNNKDFSYTYGCSLTKEIYIKHNWASTLDTDIDNIFIKEGEIYSK